MDHKRHLNTPHDGARRYRVFLHRSESPALPRMTEEGFLYRYPIHQEECIVWANSIADLPGILRSHCQEEYVLLAAVWQQEDKA